MIPEITIKITMRPDEVTISQGQTETTLETFAILAVPETPDEFAENASFAPPQAEEKAAMFTGGDIDPPEAEETIPGSTGDEPPPDLPPGE